MGEVIQGLGLVASTPKALMLCDELLEVGMKVSEATYHAAVEKLGERQTFEVPPKVWGGAG